MNDPKCNAVAKEKQRLAKDNITDNLSLEKIAASVRSASWPLTLKPTESGEAFQSPAAASPGDPDGDDPTSISPPELVSASQVAQVVARDGQQPESRTIAQSLEYEPHQLFTVFCNAMVASLKMEQIKPSIFDDSFHKNGRLKKDSVVLELNGSGSGHKWKILPEDVRVCGGEWVYKKSHGGPFLIVQLLGSGETSKVWRAVTKKENTSYACVIKYWIKVFDESTNETWDIKKIQRESKKSTGDEVTNYKKIYGDFSSLVGRKKLNSRWCVILPFFKPIPKDKRNEETLKIIEEVLNEQFYKEKESKSYQFKDCDWRWRHVGERDDRIVLFDLADLTVKDNADKAAHHKYVKEHIEELRKRMPQQQEL